MRKGRGQSWHILVRKGSARQRGAHRSQRIAPAKVAFKIEGTINPTATYLLVDDVMTTGATIKYVATALRRAGVTVV